MVTDDALALRFDEPLGSRSIVLEDNGQVAYAYLQDGGQLVGDVWLYNVGANPPSVNWRDESAMPFKNPARLCSDDPLERLTPNSVIRCAWSAEGVEVFVGGLLWARLWSGSRPGCSRGARLAGALAKPLGATGHLGPDQEQHDHD